MSTHTPGPWRWECDDRDIEQRLISASEKQVLTWWGKCDDAGINVRPADARLIAAAPALLEALEGILSSMDDRARGQFLRTFAQRDAYAAARAALKELREAQ